MKSISQDYPEYKSVCGKLILGDVQYARWDGDDEYFTVYLDECFGGKETIRGKGTPTYYLNLPWAQSLLYYLQNENTKHAYAAILYTEDSSSATSVIYCYDVARVHFYRGISTKTPDRLITAVNLAK